jgi:transcriptional regulator of acetoin/glycerol metabolism
VLEASHLPDALREAMATYGRRDAGRVPSQPPATDLAATAQGQPSPAFAMPRGGAPTEPELRALLSAHRGNVAAVGRLLGKERMQIHRWMKRYGITVDDYRQG